MRVVIRSRIRLSALATERISSGPRSGSGGAAPFRLKFSAAFAIDDSGAVKARAAHNPSMLTLTIANSKVTIQGPAQNGRLPQIRQDLCGNHRAVRQRDADPVVVAITRKRKYPVAAVKPAMQAAQVRPIQIPGGGNGTRRQAFDIELWKRPRNISVKPGPLGPRSPSPKAARRRQAGRDRDRSWDRAAPAD